MDRTDSKIDTGLAQVGSLDVPTIRRQLDALRLKHGAASEIGGHCSNLLQQLKNYPDAFGDAKAHLEKSIAKSVAALARLTAPNADDGETR